MTYRGLSPRTTLVRWGLVAIAFGIVLGATAPAALHGLTVAWDSNRLSLPWVFERTFAFLGYAAMAGSVIYGLLLSTKLLDAIAHRSISFALHQDLAAIGLGLAAIHGVLLVADHSMPFTLTQVAVPGLAPYAPFAVGLGQASLYLMAVVIASFYARRRIGQRAWRLLHYVTFLAFVGATAHGILAGTDTAAPWARGIYLGAVVAVVFLFAYRVAASILGGPRRRATVHDPRTLALTERLADQGGPAPR